MKTSVFSLVLLLISGWAWAVAPSGQQTSIGAQAATQTPAPGAPTTRRRSQMQAMCKEHMEAMQADTQQMQSAFDKMKANVASISNADEKARWQANLDMWQTVLGHHQMMLKHMEDMQSSGMGCGMMMGGMGMGRMPPRGSRGPMNPNSTPAPEPK